MTMIGRTILLSDTNLSHIHYIFIRKICKFIFLLFLKTIFCFAAQNGKNFLLFFLFSHFTKNKDHVE